jgi:hypothetical protein
MTSEAQREASRLNALKSTGPRTERGKERSRLNALRHGLRAKHLVARGEDFADFGRFGAELRAALKPADAFEEHLVEDIALSTWRLRRLWKTEAAVIRRAERSADAWERPALAPVPFALAGRELERLSRYETALKSSLQRAYALLERRQARNTPSMPNEAEDA